jgi:pumilio family protein 6
MSSSAENKKRKLTKKSNDGVQKKKKVHFSIENSENVTPKKLDFDALSSSLKSRATEKLAQVAAAKRQARVKPDPTMLSNVKLIKKQLKTKQKQMEIKQKKKKHINIVQDKENTTFRQRLKERQKLRRGVLYDMADKSKKIWEILRRDETTNEVRVKLCGELMKVIEGNVKFLSMAHDTTRVLECLIQFGNEQQKQYIFEQIQKDLPVMSKSLYAHHIIMKFLTHGTDTQKDLIKKSLYGHVCKLARHSIGCRVLEYCYNDICNSAERFQLVQEFYGREFAVLKTTDVKNIEDLLVSKSATGQRTNVLEYMLENLLPCIQKDLLSTSIVHRVMHEYLRNGNEKGREELVDAVKEKLIKMIHSRDGARVAIYCLWYGTNKDRKLLIRSLKSFVVKIAKEEQGYPVLWTIFDIVDDTKLVSKIVLQELMSNFDEIINDPHGKKVLMYLIAPRNTKHLQYDLVQLMKASDALNTSKKDAEIRQRELFDYCKSYFLEYFTGNILSTLKDGFKGFMMTEMMDRLSPTDDLSAFYTSLSDVLSASSVEPQAETNLIEHQTAHNVLRHLIMADGKRQKKNPQKSTLVSTLLSSISPDILRTWILCNRGCFIFVMMLEHGQNDECQQLRSLLVPAAVDTLKRQAFTGARILVEKLLSSS